MVKTANAALKRREWVLSIALTHTPHTHTTLTSVHYANNKQRFLQIKAKQTTQRGGKQPKNILRIRHVVAAVAARTRFHSKIDLCVAFKRKDKQNQEICCNIYQTWRIPQLWHHYSSQQQQQQQRERKGEQKESSKYTVHFGIIKMWSQRGKVVVKCGCGAGVATICIIHICSSLFVCVCVCVNMHMCMYLDIDKVYALLWQ